MLSFGLLEEDLEGLRLMNNERMRFKYLLLFQGQKPYQEMMDTFNKDRYLAKRAPAETFASTQCITALRKEMDLLARPFTMLPIGNGFRQAIQNLMPPEIRDQFPLPENPNLTPEDIISLLDGDIEVYTAYENQPRTYGDTLPIVYRLAYYDSVDLYLPIARVQRPPVAAIIPTFDDLPSEMLDTDMPEFPQGMDQPQ